MPENLETALFFSFCFAMDIKQHSNSDPHDDREHLLGNIYVINNVKTFYGNTV